MFNYLKSTVTVNLSNKQRFSYLLQQSQGTCILSTLVECIGFELQLYDFSFRSRVTTQNKINNFTVERAYILYAVDRKHYIEHCNC